MFEQRNRAPSRTLSGQYPWLDAILPKDIETQAGAAAAARASWVGAAWIALGFALSVLGDVLFSRYIALAMDTGLLVAMAGFAWTLRRRQPRWAIIIVLVLLCTGLALQLAGLQLNVFLIAYAWLIYLTVHALRGAFRVAAYRRGDRVDKEAVANVFQ